MTKLAADITPTAYNTWFADCKPVAIEDNRLILHTPSDFKRGIILNRFGNTLREALYDLFSCDFEIVVLAGAEIDKYLENKKENKKVCGYDGYTFDRFVVGPSNKFAYAASIAVSENPGELYNPLFIYGNSGLGKTHLLLAISAAIRKRDPSIKVAYVKGDDFTVQMIQSIQTGTTEEFRKKYRYVDLFLVDDIQFISGKQSTQEEFFHTFNNLYEQGKQIVITADRPPMDMNLLDDRLRTRFEGGLLADVQPPDLETRAAIIRNKAAQTGLPLSDDVVEYIAVKVTSNIRQIEGVVKRLSAYRDILQDSITKDSVDRAIKDVVKQTSAPTPDMVISECARYYDVSPEEIKSQSRTKSTSSARQMSMYLMRSLTGLSLSDIGQFYGDRNHSTVLSSIRKVEGLIKADPAVAAAVKDITSNINSRG